MPISTAVELRSRWNDVRTSCTDKAAAELLKVISPVKLTMTGGVVVVYVNVQYAFHRQRILSPAIRGPIQRAIATVLGAPVVIEIQTETATNTPIKSTRPAYTRGAMRAIPTTYAGIEFRSRLEANTAMLLDTADIEWRYEVEGYDLGGVWYLPDFFLPDLTIFLEVKGIFDGKSKEKVLRLATAVSAHDMSVIMLTDMRPRMLPPTNQTLISASHIKPTEVVKVWRCLVCGNRNDDAEGGTNEECEALVERLLTLHYQQVKPTPPSAPPCAIFYCSACDEETPHQFTATVHAAEVVPQGYILVRCPKCHKGLWKRAGARACPLCGKTARSARDYEPIYQKEKV